MKIAEMDGWWDDDNTRRFRWHERGERALKPIHYWSYGMLCDPANMRFEHAEMVGRAYLDNYKLELLTHANVIPSEGTGMWGTLWRVNFNILKQLDMVEGYPSYYTRIVRPVVTDDGHRVETQIYVMTDASRQRSLDSRTSEKYVRSIARGYRHAGIPLEQLSVAVRDYNSRVRAQQDSDTEDTK